MRFYTQQHPFYCGIDLHARTMYLCILDQAGETLLHRNMTATPEALLTASPPTASRSSWRPHACVPGTGLLTSARTTGSLLSWGMPST